MCGQYVLHLLLTSSQKSDGLPCVLPELLSSCCFVASRLASNPTSTVSADSSMAELSPSHTQQRNTTVSLLIQPISAAIIWFGSMILLFRPNEEKTPESMVTPQDSNSDCMKLFIHGS